MYKIAFTVKSQIGKIKNVEKYWKSSAKMLIDASAW